MNNEKMSRKYYGWIARDKRGVLRLYDTRPLKFKWFGEWSHGLGILNPEDFPEVTWENSPQQVEITLKTINKIDK